MRRHALLILVGVLALAVGCGGSTSRHAARATPVAATSCETAAAARARARLRLDIAAIRRAARLKTRDTLKGNEAVNTATDRFLLDLARAPIDLIEKNRMIDHAAGALVGACEQCFQALEAGRPIPAIAHGGRCAK
ncbi:MAG TPA: hypothetical protein VF101_15670 [Gaiellaceae bacterium]